MSEPLQTLTNSALPQAGHRFRGERLPVAALFQVVHALQEQPEPGVGKGARE